MLSPLLLLLLPLASAQKIGSFNFGAFYPQGCRTGMESYTASAAAPSYSLKSGSTAYLCLTFNGRVTSLFNVVVDQYTALSISGSAYGKRK